MRKAGVIHHLQEGGRFTREEVLIAALERNYGNLCATSRELGITRSGLNKHMTRHSLHDKGREIRARVRNLFAFTQPAA
jgi:transcriptional regulator of acetoin/glycerol metabolism